MISAIYIITFEDLVNAGRMFEALQAISQRVRYSPGCLQSDVWKNEERNAYMVFEVWSTRTDFERYINSLKYKRFLTVLEMASEKPSINISECENVRGIDLIEEIMKPLAPLLGNSDL